MKTRNNSGTVLWLTQFLLTFLSSLFLSWLILAEADFLYSFNYTAIDIDESIAEYAPLNQYRKNFGETSRMEHVRLFGEIVDGVTVSSERLPEISYKSDDGTPIDTLLTAAEITHLRDVEKLISIISIVGYTSLFAVVVLAAFLWFRKVKFPSIARLHAYGLAAIVAVGVVITLVGAEKVFYAAHVWIFPPEHQWFFYYEESLMTTLMKAPDLFALIAVELLVLGLIIYSAILFSLKKLYLRTIQ